MAPICIIASPFLYSEEEDLLYISVASMPSAATQGSDESNFIARMEVMHLSWLGILLID
jgi:hypothetical protein